MAGRLGAWQDLVSCGALSGCGCCVRACLWPHELTLAQRVPCTGWTVAWATVATVASSDTGLGYRAQPLAEPW
jgi:hypothetical protein